MDNWDFYEYQEHLKDLIEDILAEEKAKEELFESSLKLRIEEYQNKCPISRVNSFECLSCGHQSYNGFCWCITEVNK